MGKDCDDFADPTLLDKSIVNDYLLAPRQSVEIGVAVSTSLGAIDDIEMFQREFETRSQGLHFGLQLAIFQRREFVEQRHDEDGISGNHEGLHHQDEQPDVVEEIAAKVVDDFQKAGEDRAA